MQSNTKNLILFYFLLFLFFGFIIELGSYFFLNQNDQGENSTSSSRHIFHPYRGHALNTEYRRDFDTGGKKIHSDDGFRSDVIINKDKPDDVYRIIMLGGSTLYGIGATGVYDSTPTLDNNQTVPYFLQSMISEHLAEQGVSKRVEVINAGVTAYTTFHHLVYFNEVLYEYNPDLLIFLDGHNDFYYYEQYNNWQRMKQGTPKLTHHFNQRSGWFTGISVARYFAQYSRFFMLVEKYMMRVWKDPDLSQFAQSGFPRSSNGTFPDNIDAVLNESIIKTYVQFEALSTLFNFDTIVFLQPQVVFENTSVLSEADQRIQAITVEHDTNTQRAEIRPYFADIFKQKNLDFVDIGEIASPELSNEQLYTDYCHLTPKGSEVVAQLMLPHLNKFLDALQ